MAQSGGWKTYMLGFMGMALLGVIASYAALSYSKASEKDLEEHVKEPAHLEQRIVNERIYNRLGNLEQGQQVMQQSILALPAAIVKELKK